MAQLRVAAFGFPLGGTARRTKSRDEQARSVVWRGNMSASAREPGSPPSFSDELSDGSQKDAPLGDAAIRDGTPRPIYDGPKKARQTEPKQDPTRPGLSTPSAVTQTTETSQPPWKQKRPR